LAIPRALAGAAAQFAAGERRARALLEPVRALLEQAELRLDYADIAEPDQLFPLNLDELVGERVLVAIAAFCGTTRLIDNLVLGEDEPPALAPP
jgi:pantothenate synthetase